MLSFKYIFFWEQTGCIALQYLPIRGVLLWFLYVEFYLPTRGVLLYCTCIYVHEVLMYLEVCGVLLYFLYLEFYCTCLYVEFYCTCLYGEFYCTCLYVEFYCTCLYMEFYCTCLYVEFYCTCLYNKWRLLYLHMYTWKFPCTFYQWRFTLLAYIRGVLLYLPICQRKFIDWKKTKLFRFRWNWADDQNLRGIRLQISSSPPPTCRLLVYSRQWRSFTPLEGVVRIL